MANKGQIFNTYKEELKQEVREYIHFYNHNRFQEKLKALSTTEYREKAAA